MTVRRVYVTGGTGAGKTTFATELASRVHLPVHHLDEIARVGGGRGPESAHSDRRVAVAQILATDGWIAEGVQLGWTQSLIDAADHVVWLDHVAWHRSTGRILRRFAGGALAEARRRRGRERFLRFGDYARKLRELFVSVPETRTFPRAELDAALAGVTPDRLVHCTTESEVRDALETLSAATPAS